MLWHSPQRSNLEWIRSNNCSGSSVSGEYANARLKYNKINKMIPSASVGMEQGISCVIMNRRRCSAPQCRTRVLTLWVIRERSYTKHPETYKPILLSAVVGYRPEGTPGAV